jgi:hypothetical protein
MNLITPPFLCAMKIGRRRRTIMHAVLKKILAKNMIVENNVA